MKQRHSQGPASSVFDAIRRLASTLLATTETRLRLAVIEIQQERNRFLAILIMSFIALMLALFGIGMLILLLVVYFWETDRLLAIGSAAAALLFLAIIFAWRARVLANRPTLLRSTLNRLVEDHGAIAQRLRIKRLDEDKE